MGEDGKIIYKVVINDDGVESEAQAAGQKAGSGVEQGAKGGANSFQEMMIGAARKIGAAFVEMAAKAVKGVEEIAKAGIEFNAKMETYQTAFTTLIGDADKAAAALERIREDAASTPFDVDSLTQANQALLATGMDADKARTDVMNLANAIAATGGGSAELSRMAANMQQIRNTGKATAMDIRQFANAGINIYGLLADSLGITAEEAANLDVTYEQLTEAFAKAANEGGMYAGALDAQAQTFNGRMATLKDNALQLAGVLTQDIFNRLSSEGLPRVMDWVAKLLNAAKSNGIPGAVQAAKEILSNLINSFLEKLPEMADTGVKMIINLINGFAGSSSALPKVMNAVLTIIKSIVQAILNNLPQLLQAGARLVVSLVNGLIQSIPQLLSAAAQLCQSLLNAFFTVDWASIGVNIVQGVWNGIVSLWDTLVDKVTSAVNRLWTSAKNALSISSPSKKFKYIGEMSVEGMKEGFEEGEADMNKTVSHFYSGMLNAAGGANLGSASAMESAVSYNLSATGGNNQIVVPLYLDGREIARATAWSMGQQLAWEQM